MSAFTHAVVSDECPYAESGEHKHNEEQGDRKESAQMNGITKNKICEPKNERLTAASYESEAHYRCYSNLLTVRADLRALRARFFARMANSSTSLRSIAVTSEIKADSLITSGKAG